MDSLINAAAQSLRKGDPLGALKRVALREDAPALALRGIAMAQLGDLARARLLLKQAARAFGPKEAPARARAVVAEAEIALAGRDLTWPPRRLDAAQTVLEKHADRINAAYAGHIAIKRLLLIGRLDEVERRMARLDPRAFPPALKAAHELVAAGIAIRRLRIGDAETALARSMDAAHRAAIPALVAEVENASRALTQPAARLLAEGKERLLTLTEVENLLAGRTLVVDACRHAMRDERLTVSLARRPVLFTLLRALAEAWPQDVTRGTLLARAFRAKQADESHRARLRVEMGRLRGLIKPFAGLRATPQGFALRPRRAARIAVLAPPIEGDHGAVVAFLADGEAWSSSALALALGMSQRSVQRSLDALLASGKVGTLGKGRARRWTAAPLPGFATALLLPVALPDG
jgi:hypothetical protein